jgi:DNA-binding HxlR family transcriptional regulator
VARSLDAIGDWWSLLILREAFGGKRRFSEFQKSLGVARNILTTRLKKLVGLEIFEMAPASDGSAFQEYALTEKGRGLYIVIMALRQWGEGCLYGAEEPKYVVVERATGEPILPLELRSRDGRVLQPEDVLIVPTGQPCPDSTEPA